MARFVVADDLASMRAKNRAFLERGGHTVIAEAENGQTAVDRCREHRPDAILIDTQMPVLDGLSAARIIMDDGLVACRVIAVSSAKQSMSAYNAIGAYFIKKPFHEDDFLQHIARALSGVQQQSR